MDVSREPATVRLRGGHGVVDVRLDVYSEDRCRGRDGGMSRLIGTLGCPYPAAVTARDGERSRDAGELCVSCEPPYGLSFHTVAVPEIRGTT